MEINSFDLEGKMSKCENKRAEEERTEAKKKNSLGGQIREAAGFMMFAGACVGAGTLVGAANYFYKKIFVPKKYKERKYMEIFGSEYADGRSWVTGHPAREHIYIRSEDGLQLHANLIPSDNPDCHRYAVCVHDYASSSANMGIYARVYHDRYGMNTLLPDLRGYGLSDGDYVGMGYHDSRDLLSWLDWILQKDPDAQIVLHGISMGAAAILMATGLSLPSQVRAAVSDSSYASLGEMIRLALKKQTNPNIPSSLMLESLRAAVLVRAGYDICKVSPVESVTRSKTPTLFIHGQADKSVPQEMMPRLYKAASCTKSFLWIPGAEHVQAVNVDPETYWARVERFIHGQDMDFSE